MENSRVPQSIAQVGSGFATPASRTGVENSRVPQSIAQEGSGFATPVSPTGVTDGNTFWRAV
ncbi:MAG: hypothetical protein GX125_01050 [Bacteroidales bacterium]|nr:hypothetical protein [Bacteroidota bacterium]NLN98847.1 hypothetical protein [Bacteroidales bacterium]